jgi:hypothetical protein
MCARAKAGKLETMPLESQISVHLPQCPVCGLPMSIALIGPDSAHSGAEKRVYQCLHRHSLLTSGGPNAARTAEARRRDL